MRLSRLLVLSMLAVLVFSACTPGSVPTTTATPAQPAVSASPSPDPSPIPSSTSTPLPAISVDPAALKGLNILVWHAFAGPAADLITNQAASFNASNEWGIVVTPAGYGDYTTLFDSVNTALVSGPAPDLVAALPEQALTWEAGGNVVDLKAYIDNPKWGLATDTTSDIPEIFWAQDNINGKQLGIPAQRSARLILYNQTWAHELGFTNLPSTADEFRQQACAANASFQKDTDATNDGYGGWIVDNDWQTTYSWLLAFGGGLADGSAYTFRTDPNLATLQFIKGLFDKHCAWVSTGTAPFDSFARRSALFISTDLAGLAAETESMTGLKNSDVWTVLPFPGTQAEVMVTYGPSYTVLKSTPEKQLAAWLFARWMLSPENQAQWVEATGLFPLRNSVLDMIGPYRQASPQWDAAVANLPHARNVPQLASWRKVRYVLEDGMTVLFQENLPADKLTMLLEQMDSMAQELK